MLIKPLVDLFIDIIFTIYIFYSSKVISSITLLAISF